MTIQQLLDEKLWTKTIVKDDGSIIDMNDLSFNELEKSFLKGDKKTSKWSLKFHPNH